MEDMYLCKMKRKCFQKKGTLLTLKNRYFKKWSHVYTESQCYVPLFNFFFTGLLSRVPVFIQVDDFLFRV